MHRIEEHDLDDIRCLDVFRWLWILFQGVLYSVFVVIACPWLILFKVKTRPPSEDDGVELGYDDNDPGSDVDG